MHQVALEEERTGLKLLGLKFFSEFSQQWFSMKGMVLGFLFRTCCHLLLLGSFVSSQAFAGVGVRLVAVPKGTAGDGNGGRWIWYGMWPEQSSCLCRQHCAEYGGASFCLC